ncbi:MAG: L,D-transpeptidase family protein [Burkholderiaceae bacterium]|nr:L,D-transpeptidase family protein [Burkholderiaceae bacterium]
MTPLRRLARAAAFVLATVGAAGAAAGAAFGAEVRAQVRAAEAISAPVTGAALPATAANATERAELQRLYPNANLLWLDASGRTSDAARDAIKLLAAAENEGLDPADYGIATLSARAPALPDASPATRAEWDAAFSLAVLRYLRDLHFGRVDPKALGFRVSPRRADEQDLAARLAGAIAQRRVTQLAAELVPQIPQYAELRDALARYRQLAHNMPATVLAPQKTSVRPGDPYADADALRLRLAQLGDLPAGTPQGAGPIYDAALAEGVTRFQARHGLAADGVLGKATLTALNVPIAQRVRQIEFGLERMRWLPQPDGQRILAINIPMFRLWAWGDDPRSVKPALAIDVIVGRALKTQTPVFSDKMRYLVFRPYWNVPRSITRNEVLPAIARDPGYLAKHDMEIVRGASDNAQVLAPTPESVALLRDGTVRVRQRPGPNNSLGLVKFIFPNDANIYLHSTPAQSLFERSRRDFSHGCVRVEDPVALAEWVLQDQPQWTRERIVAAMQETPNLRVNLSQPLPVLLYYVTAIVSPEDGRLHFSDDIYGHDKKLARALAAQRLR